MDNTMHVSWGVHLREIADRMAQAGVPSAPLYAAAAAGEVGLISIADHQSPWPAAAVLRVSRPLIVLIGGDPGWGEPTYGPDGWACSRALRRWARCAVVHGGRGERDHYRSIVPGAVAMRRLVMVETTSALVHDWRAFFSNVPTFAFLPEEGAVHPTPPECRH